MSSDCSNDFLLSLVSEPLVARIGSGTALPFLLTGVQKYGQDKKNTARALLSTPFGIFGNVTSAIEG